MTLLTRYIECEDRTERSALYLEITAEHIDAGREQTWEIPSIRANTLRGIAEHLRHVEAKTRAATIKHVVELERRNYDRLALCSDHRDKATGRCIVCVAEERTKREVEGKRE